MCKITLAIIASVLVSPTRAVAQDALWLRPGSKVRMTAPALDLSDRVGRVHELNGDTLVVLVDALHTSRLRLDVVDVPLSSISKLEVVTGRRGHWLEGAGIGFLLGVVTGAASGDDPSNAYFGYSAGEKAAIGGLSFGLIGAGIGALIKSDKWAEVPLDRVRPKLIVGDRGQVGIRFALVF